MDANGTAQITPFAPQREEHVKNTPAPSPSRPAQPFSHRECARQGTFPAKRGAATRIATRHGSRSDLSREGGARLRT